MKLVSQYESHRNSTLNLIPSENILSQDVLKALGSSMAGRYAGRPESYGGNKLFHDIWRNSEEPAKKVFRANYASVMPISGHIAGVAAIDLICKRGDRIATIAADYGGYKGYNEAFIPSFMGLKVDYLPFDSNAWNLDVPRVLEHLETRKPSLVILGATVFLFPHPVREIARTVHSYGGKVIYDGSHVLGLIAGNCFQDPLREGADVLLGSTHKTLFGPQGGLIVTNDDEIGSKIADRFLYTFVDNFHLNRVAALGIALEEIRIHGTRYARNIIKNSKALATNLAKQGLTVACEDSGFTESHQVFLNYKNTGTEIRDNLETNNIISDSRVRLGTNEVTRRGMKTKEMAEIAALVSESLSHRNNSKIKRRVRALVYQYSEVHYTLEN